MSRRMIDVTPDLLLRAYRAGLFPMAETRHGSRLYWLDPELRGVLPLDGFHLSKRLLRTTLSNQYEVTSDTAFAAVVANCAAAAPGRQDTWINADIERLFGALHRLGHAHSIESRQDGVLVGGLYGVAVGGAFSGESMFHLAPNASKLALLFLIDHLRGRGLGWMDIQMMTPHMAALGAHEVPRDAFLDRLEAGHTRGLQLFG